MAVRRTLAAQGVILAGLLAASAIASPAPEPGERIDAPLPPLGDISGLGQATAGLAPARLLEALQKAASDADATLRAPAFGPAVGAIGKPVALVVTPERLGSATLVGTDGRFITSWRTVQGQAKVGLIFMPQGQDARPTEADAVEASVSATDPARDLALLKRPDAPKGVKPVTLLANTPLRAGTRLRIVGHPYGEIWSVSDGSLKASLRGHAWTAASGSEHRADVIRFRSTGATGNAGDPVFDIKGRMIAMDVSPADSGTLTSLAVTATEIQRFLARPARDTASKMLERATARKIQAPVQAAPSCRPVQISANRTRSDDGTIHAIDLDCNTSPDARLTIPDSRTQPAELAVDADQDTVPESIYLDNDRDGQFDEARFDTNADGRPDLVGTELDPRLVPRRTRALPR